MLAAWLYHERFTCVGRTSRKAVHVQELHTLHSNGRARASLGLRLGYWLGVRVGFRVRLGFGLRVCRVLRASCASAGLLLVEVLMEIGQHLFGRRVVVLLALLLALLVLQEMLPPRRVPARVAEIAL